MSGRPGRDERIAELAHAGWSLRAIAVEVGVSHVQVGRLLALRVIDQRSERVDRRHQIIDQLRDLTSEVGELTTRIVRLNARAKTLRTEMVALDEELEAAELDLLLGLTAVTSVTVTEVPFHAQDDLGDR